ncbi:MAG: hypothetical protein ABSC23_03505 [Bryobacteraceae bacterium]|jgi:hypothetical protein
MSIAAASAADKDSFHAPAVAHMAHRQTNGQVTIGADPYLSGEKVKAAFDKLNPYQYDVLPVLVVIQNGAGQTLRVDNLHVEYVGPNGDRVMATPAGDVKYVHGPSRPGMITGPGAGVKVLSKKNPLDAWEIEGRAFAAKMLPAGQTASGFFYFATGIQRGATLYLSGITEAATGKELLYFEIPLE